MIEDFRKDINKSIMELKKVIFAGALALTLGACSSTTASSKAASSAKDSASAASSATEEEVETKGSYKVTNLTGEKITGLYYYETGSDDKGENWAGDDGIEPDGTVQVDVEVSEDEAKDYKMTVEYVTEGGDTVKVFDSLSLETADMYLKPAADVEGGATPFLNNAE